MNYDEGIILLFTIYATYVLFNGMLGLLHTSAAKSGPEDISSIEWTMWHGNLYISTALKLFLLAGRLNGIAFLIYLFVSRDWYTPILFFSGALAITFFIITALRMSIGILLPSFLAFVVIPVTGVLMWILG